MTSDAFAWQGPAVRGYLQGSPVSMKLADLGLLLRRQLSQLLLQGVPLGHD
jgi:hypothetical protein